jgi:hypothetical protein
MEREHSLDFIADNGSIDPRGQMHTDTIRRNHIPVEICALNTWNTQ